MTRNILGCLLVFGLGMIVGGCSKGEDDEGPPPKEWSAEEAKLREAIFRDGTVTRALEEYMFAIGSYPTTDQGLQALIARPKGLRDPKTWAGPYLKEKDQDGIVDPWGTELKYVMPGKTHENKYDIISAGPDKQFDTDDDLLNWDIR